MLFYKNTNIFIYLQEIENSLLLLVKVTMSSTPSNPFPDIPELGITIKVSPMLLEAYDYYAQKMDKSVVDHCVCSMYWAVLLSRHKKFERLKFNWDVVFLAVLLHDFGLSTDKSLISDDRRFEVDGANITRQFLEDRGGDAWTEHLQLVWDAIALHTTASIAHHKEPEVVLTSFAVMADNVWPQFPRRDAQQERLSRRGQAFPSARLHGHRHRHHVRHVQGEAGGDV